MTHQELIERLRGLLGKATPGPWCWQQCGDKCDDPVIGVAWREDDDTYTAIPGFLHDFDAEGNEIGYYRESIAFLGDGNSRGDRAATVAKRAVEAADALCEELAK